MNGRQQTRWVETQCQSGWLGGDKARVREREVPQGGSAYAHLTWCSAVSDSEAVRPAALTQEMLEKPVTCYFRHIFSSPSIQKRNLLSKIVARVLSC